jgi:hypothetical protein
MSRPTTRTRIPELKDEPGIQSAQDQKQKHDKRRPGIPHPPNILRHQVRSCGEGLWLGGRGLQVSPRRAWQQKGREGTMSVTWVSTRPRWVIGSGYTNL